MPSPQGTHFFLNILKDLSVPDQAFRANLSSRVWGLGGLGFRSLGFRVLGFGV